MASTIPTTPSLATTGCDPGPLLEIILESLALHQAVFAVAELGVADLLCHDQKSAKELSSELKVDESSLYRLMRLLVSQSIFAEVSPRVFANNPVSNCLRSSAPISLRALARFRGSEFIYRPFGEILHSVRTGESGRLKAFGMDGWEYLRQNPEAARRFDDAMTDISSLVAPAIARAYNFAQWESLMDVGGGNGLMLAAILRTHTTMRGVLSDQQHVLERAKQRGFLQGELERRSCMQVCDLFNEIPSGCRAYLMKSIIHDWNDEDAQRILRNCRKSVPKDGALLLVEFDLPEGSAPAQGKFIDVAMLVLTGGKERTAAEYSSLLAKAGFRFSQTVPTSTGFNIIEALPF